jgi:L-ribulose-5-phosphate 3-epimerase
MKRRQFILAAAAPAWGQGRSRFVKSICSVIFPANTPVEECFRHARNAGFDGIEIRVGVEMGLDDGREGALRVADAARKARIEIASLWSSGSVSANPLNSPDQAVRMRGVEALSKVVDLAGWMGCGAILVVPGRLGVGPEFQVSYQDTWDRASAELKKVVSRAERARTSLCLENVWNKFLLSPLEMRSFVDQFASPAVQVQFDIGNVMQFGYPQDWILTLGSRLKRIHLKDYKLSSRAEQGRFVDLMEGDVAWKEVMAALIKVGYRGFVSAEIGHEPSDPDQLMKVSRAVDRILELA